MAKRQKQPNHPINPTIRIVREHNRLSPITACIRAACLPAGMAFLAFNAGMAYAAPQGGQVSGGQGNISTPDANTTLINQQSQNLSVNWQSFNVAKQELVQFKQPNKNATALNRIFDQNPSQIFGTIKANGNVLLINPAGVFFSPTAHVNVNSLVASSLNVSDEDFFAGNYKFKAAPGTEGGMVVNQGVLEAATGGSVSLVGGAVKNEGVILAQAGQVNLVAGNQATMDFDGDGLMQFTVDKEVLQNAQALDSAVKNTGTIEANGGSVLLAGSAAAEIFSNVVNNEGVIKAGRIENKGGVVRLVGMGSGSSVLNTGTIDVSAVDSTSDGGSVEITADNIKNTGEIKAKSENNNGGTINFVADNVTNTGTLDATSDGGGSDGLIGITTGISGLGSNNILEGTYKAEQVTVTGGAGDDNFNVDTASDMTLDGTNGSDTYNIALGNGQQHIKIADSGVSDTDNDLASFTSSKYNDNTSTSTSYTVLLGDETGKAGIFEYDFGDFTQEIDFSGLEPINDWTGTGTLTITLALGGETATIADGTLFNSGTPGGDGLATSADDAYVLTLSVGEDYAFTGYSTLTINGNTAGSDTVNVSIANSTFGACLQAGCMSNTLTTVNIDGKANADTVNINNTSGLTAINVTDTGASGTDVLTGVTNFNDATGVSGIVTASGIESVSGTGTVTGVTSFTDGAAASMSGTSTASGIVYTGFTTISGTGAGTVTGVTTFNSGNATGDSGLAYTGFATIVTPKVTNASGFTDSAATPSDGTFNFTAALTSVTGTGIVTNVSMFTLTGANIGTSGSGITYTGFGTISGTGAADVFKFNSGNLSGDVNGLGGDDLFDFNGGTVAGTVDGGPHAGGDTADFVGAGAGITVDLSKLINIESFTGDGTQTIKGTGGANTWAINGANSGSINTSTFTGFQKIQSIGTDTFSNTVTFGGNINITGSSTWNYTPGLSLTSANITGTGGSFTVPGTFGTNLTIGPGDLLLPNMAGFGGHLIIGGTITPSTGSITNATAITINTSQMTVTNPVVTGGNLSLLSNSMILNNNLTAGNELSLIASTGNIDSPAAVTLTAASGFFVAGGNLTNPSNLTLSFGGGPVEAATGTTNPGGITFGPGSSVSPPPTTTPGFQNVLNLVGALSGITFNTVNISVLNPAADLAGLQELGFIDTGLFEQDLTLFGIIGNGIALALAQCEEIEGCAPNVTEEELDQLITQLEARIKELSDRCDNGDSAACALLDGYKEQLANFKGYRQQLHDYLTAGQEDLGDEFGGEEAPATTGPEADIASLAKILESIKSRIEWLESLRTNAKERARLSKSTGIELTQEALDAIIEGAKQEILFIEEQIKLLKEGTQARLEESIFTAEAHDYKKVQEIAYGPALNMNQQLAYNDKRWY